MPQYKLTLYPATLHIIQPATGAIIAALKNCGLLNGESMQEQYFVGPAFVDLLSFLGCSPQIRLTPNEGDNYCHIIIRPPQPDIHCLGYTATAAPRCPQCKNKITQWQQIKAWHLGATPCVCQHCNTTTAMQNLKWKHECGYGCMAIDIINIHPFEAVPSDNFLHVLQTATGVEWDYFYASVDN